MHFRGIKREFDNMSRTAGLDEMNPLRDAWLNQGWEKISEEFVIPSLVKTISFDSVSDQANYLFPYDYGGTEIGLCYNRRRLDPVPDETLRLKYEKRSGNMGSVKFYDWSGIVEEDLFTLSGCTLTNGSVTVLTPSTDVRLDLPYWVRFDPYLDEDNEDKDNDDMVDPGDYGYLISEGDQVSGTSFALDKPYRGPSGDQFTVRIRPAETQQFIVYGVPSSSEEDAFSLRYSAKPKRLQNNTDVPEWPSMGLAIAYMGMSVCLEWHHNMELAKTFWGRAVQKVSGLERRRNRSRALVSDLTLGSASGRRTGVRGVFLSHTRGRGSGRYR